MSMVPFAVGGALLIVGGCQLDVPPGQNPVLYLVNQAISQDRAIGWEELAEQLASEDADLRREAVLLLGKPGRSKALATPEILSALALEDPDELVRATAIETLARIGDSETVIKILAQTSRSDSRQVRLASVKALKGHRNDKSMEILLDRLAHDEVAPIKAQVAQLLSGYRQQRVLEGLLEALNDDDFQVSYQARESLKKLTGRDFEYDTFVWKNWIKGQQDPFSALAGDYE
ncbi:MAG: HEAT repeat domain-containing protein [Planctomycetes bacterium]|nr:HEAT repeat domain-containing protein [Planctomycetota bacterium]